MDKERIQNLVDAYFDDRLNLAGREELEELLRSSEDVREVFKSVGSMEALLVQWGEEKAVSHQDKKKLVGFIHGSNRLHIARRLLLPGVGIAAMLAFSVSAWMSFNGFLPFSFRQTLAEMSYGSQASWHGNMQRPRNGRFSEGTYYLTSGFVRIDTESGATISMAAPSKFRFESSDRIHVYFGKMTARLSTEDASLNMSTDSIDIKDLGTAFGLLVESGGESSVSVFEGSVEVKNHENDVDQVMLSEGKTLKSHIEAPLQEEQESVYAENFNDLWPLALAIDDYSPLVRLMPPGPANEPLIEIQSNSVVNLFPEKQGVRLDFPVQVDLLGSGSSWPESGSLSLLGDGRSVSSFMLFFNPEKDGEEWMSRVSGEIRFGKEILGVICSHDSLSESDAWFALEGLDYTHGFGNGSRGLEDQDVIDFGYYRLAHDVIRIGEDRREIYFNFNATTLVDQVRIILED